MQLKKLRLAAGLRQVDVAEALSVDQAAISQWENGKSRPSRKYHAPLANLYGVSVATLLTAVSDDREAV